MKGTLHFIEASKSLAFTEYALEVEFPELPVKGEVWRTRPIRPIPDDGKWEVGLGVRGFRVKRCKEIKPGLWGIVVCRDGVEVTVNLHLAEEKEAE